MEQSNNNNRFLLFLIVVLQLLLIYKLDVLENEIMVSESSKVFSIRKSEYKIDTVTIMVHPK
jgi:hypothetical protein